MLGASKWRPQSLPRYPRRRTAFRAGDLVAHSKAFATSAASWSESSDTSGNKGTVKPYYVTTPIFYPNSAPHIGHLHTLVTGDAFARFARMADPTRPVKLLVGTDEHGLKIQRAAKANGEEVGAFCDRISRKFKDLADLANVNYTRFIRTTERAHYEAVSHVWQELNTKGLIYKSTYEGWYSVSDETFYTPAQVHVPSPGTSEQPYAIETGSAVEWTEESNYKFRLSALHPALLEHFSSASPTLPYRYDSAPARISPPQYLSSVLSTLSSAPLEDLSVSRPAERLSWGVPVPGDERHTIYVWLDALCVYLTGAGYPFGADNGTGGGWPADMQVIGKDILRFHAIYFPAFLLALGLTPPRSLLAHAHWTVAQRKMSKSVGNVADPLAAIEEFGVDVVRFYLARTGGRFKDDVDWSTEQLKKHADEITSLLGNYFLRVTSKAIYKRISGVPPEERLTAQDVYSDLQAGEPNFEILAQRQTVPSAVKQALEKRDLAEAVAVVVHLLKQANAALTEIAPWASSTSPEKAQEAQATALEVLRVAGICLQPVMPDTADRLLTALEVGTEERSLAHAERWGEVGVSGAVTGIKLFDKRV